MIKFTRVPREEMAQRHARHRAKFRPKVIAGKLLRPRVLNTQQVLDLGNLTFFSFRGRPYGVPMLTYKDGMRLLKLQTQIEVFVGRLTAETLPKYHSLLKRIAKELWRLTTVVGWRMRVLRRLHLLRNPFDRCTETELGELLDFFSKRRMRSGALFPAVERIPDPLMP